MIQSNTSSTEAQSQSTTQLIDRQSGSIQEIPNEGGEVTATGASDLHLGISATDIIGSMRVGDDLIINLANGAQIIVRQFFSFFTTGEVLDTNGTAMVIAEYGTEEGSSSTLLAVVAGAAAGLAALGGSGGGSDNPADTPPVDRDRDTDAGPTAAEQALTRINAYNRSNQAPTLADYNTLGVTNVTAANLAAVNELVAGSANDALTAANVHSLAMRVNNALGRINAHDGTSATETPTQTDYETAGVTGVTAANLTAVNMRVAASQDDQLTAVEIQSLVTASNAASAATTALDKINNYDAMSTAAETPLVADYRIAGVTGVTVVNLAGVNMRLASQSGTLTVVQIQPLVTAANQALVTAARQKINDYDDMSTVAETPVVADYETAGVNGVTADNLVAVNMRVAASDDNELTVEEIQSLVTATNEPMPTTSGLEKINAYDGTAATETPTQHDYEIAGVEGVTEGNLEAVNERVAGSDNDQLMAVDIQGLVAASLLEKINTYKDGDAGYDIPTVDDYRIAGVTGVAEANLAGVNMRVAAESGTLMAAQVQPLVIAATQAVVTAALRKFNAYDGTNDAPTFGDYVAAGVWTSLVWHDEFDLNPGFGATEFGDYHYQNWIDGSVNGANALIAALNGQGVELTSDRLQHLLYIAGRVTRIFDGGRLSGLVEIDWDENTVVTVEDNFVTIIDYLSLGGHLGEAVVELNSNGALISVTYRGRRESYTVNSNNQYIRREIDTHDDGIADEIYTFELNAAGQRVRSLWLAEPLFEEPRRINTHELNAGGQRVDIDVERIFRAYGYKVAYEVNAAKQWLRQEVDFGADGTVDEVREFHFRSSARGAQLARYIIDRDLDDEGFDVDRYWAENGIFYRNGPPNRFIRDNLRSDASSQVAETKDIDGDNLIDEIYLLEGDYYGYNMDSVNFILQDSYSGTMLRGLNRIEFRYPTQSSKLTISSDIVEIIADGNAVHQITIDGHSGDTVNLTGDWEIGDGDSDGIADWVFQNGVPVYAIYDSYSGGSVVGSLLIDLDVTVVLPNQ